MPIKPRSKSPVEQGSNIRGSSHASQLITSGKDSRGIKRRIHSETANGRQEAASKTVKRKIGNDSVLIRRCWVAACSGPFLDQIVTLNGYSFRKLCHIILFSKVDTR